MLEIQCTQCKAFIARYRGSGELVWLYLDRVVKPDSLAKLKSVLSKTDLPILICHECGRRLGTPAVREGGRLAYRMSKGSFKRKGVVKAMATSPHTSWK